MAIDRNRLADMLYAQCGVMMSLGGIKRNVLFLEKYVNNDMWRMTMLSDEDHIYNHKNIFYQEEAFVAFVGKKLTALERRNKRYAKASQSSVKA